MSNKTIETGSVPTMEELEHAKREEEQRQRDEELRQASLIAHQGKITTLDAAAPGKLVKIRALRAIDYKGVTLAPGEIKEVSEDMAREFCDRSFTGGYDFGGERGDASATRSKTVRAERV